jgi:hypothetical protein
LCTSFGCLTDIRDKESCRCLCAFSCAAGVVVAFLARLLDSQDVGNMLLGEKS